MDVALVLASLVAGFIMVFILQNLRLYSFWSSRGIQGPIPLPIAGSYAYYLFQIKAYLDLEWREKYGRVFGLYQSYRPVLRVTDNELISEIMIKKFNSFTDRDSSTIYHESLKKWSFWSEGKYWSNQRALLTPLFASNKMKRVHVATIECSKKFTDFLANNMKQLKPDDASKLGALKAVMVSKDELMAFALDVVSSGLFGIRLDTYQAKGSEFHKRAYAFAKFDSFRFFWWSILPAFVCRRFKIDLTGVHQWEYFDKLSQTIISERRNIADGKKSQNDLVQYLIDAKIPAEVQDVYDAEDSREAHYNDNMKLDELEEIHRNQVESDKILFRSFSDIEIRSQMTFFMLAGFETTSSSLSLCLHCLAMNQQIQQEVYEELQQVAATSGELDYTSLMSLKKLDAFVSEAMRLYGPILEGQRVVTAKEGVVLDVAGKTRTKGPSSLFLPHGTIISVNPFVVHRDPEYWPEPLKFDMTRFYPENKHKILRGSYQPFGIGPRNCIGMRFALLTIKTGLAYLMLKFKVLPSEQTIEEPLFKHHFFFLQLEHTNFNLIERTSREEVSRGL